LGRLDLEKHRVPEEEFLAIEKAVIFIRHSPPLHLVPKKDGSRRPCRDYHHLNAVTVPDRYLLPNMQSLNDHKADCTVFLSRFDQSLPSDPIAKADVPKTAIATPFGLFEFLS
jgi:hypothetical protein